MSEPVKPVASLAGPREVRQGVPPWAKSASDSVAGAAVETAAVAFVVGFATAFMCCCGGGVPGGRLCGSVGFCGLLGLSAWIDGMG